MKNELLESVDRSAVETTARQEQPLTYLAANGDQYHTMILTDLTELRQHIDDWTDLSTAAASPNVFYEPWFFLAAAEQYSQGESWQIMLLYRTSKQSPEKTELCGFFPFIKTKKFGVFSQLTLWKHDYCYLCEPLVRKHQEIEVLNALLSVLRASPDKVHYLDLNLIRGEGPVWRAWVNLIRDQLLTTYVQDRYLRAKVDLPTDSEEYFRGIIHGRHLREYRRQRRKLESLGQLEYRILKDARGTAVWTEWFLNLEAKGWKSEAGTAMVLNEKSRSFFQKMIAQGVEQNRVRLEGLFLNGEPVAMKCNLLSLPGCYAFKIAFNEEYARFSPGIQMEIESLRQAVEDRAYDWNDSCAVSDHQMINRMWSERQIIQHLTVSTGRALSTTCLGTLPLLKSIYRSFKRTASKFTSLLGRFKQSPPAKENS